MFLGMKLECFGNLTQSSSKPLRELFGTFLRRKKYIRKNRLNYKERFTCKAKKLYM